MTPTPVDLESERPAVARAQTPAQWAVRWHGLVLGALLIGMGPVLGLAWLGRPPLVRTASQTPWPESSWATIADGTWMPTLERHLREASPEVWVLRGAYNELRLSLGVLQTGQVLVGADGWLFLRSTLAVDEVALAAGVAARRARLVALRQRAEAAGAILLAMPVPDKVRIYPEPVFGAGGLPPAKAALYGAILADLAAAGIPTVDAAAALRAVRATRPEELLYYRRDTHWSLPGAVTVAMAASQRLQAPPFAERIGAKVEFRLGAPMRVEVIPDLGNLLGLLTWSERRPELGIDLGRPASLRSSRLLETKEYWTVEPVAGPIDPVTAAVALAGTSFSVGNGGAALQWFLGRGIDLRAVRDGNGNLQGLEEVLGRMERGESHARVVVWEFVERTWGAALWQPGTAPGGGR